MKEAGEMIFLTFGVLWSSINYLELIIYIFLKCSYLVKAYVRKCHSVIAI